jgi:hypothetical protein
MTKLRWCKTEKNRIFFFREHWKKEKIFVDVVFFFFESSGEKKNVEVFF